MRTLSTEVQQRIAELHSTIDQAKHELSRIRIANQLKAEPATLDQTKQAARLVNSYRCPCGAKKRPGVVFCDLCFHTLPEFTRDRLRMMLKNSFVMAVNEALRALDLRMPKHTSPIETKPDAAMAQTA